VAVPEKAKQKTPLDVELSDTIKSELTEVDIDEHSHVVGKKIVDLSFPRSVLIAMIKRKGKFITPNGATVIEPHDKLVIIADNPESMQQVRILLEEQEKPSGTQ
jgi:cell volume regulation protein A